MTTIVARPVVGADISLSAEQLATAAGISPARLARLLRLGLVDPSAPGAQDFTAAMAARLRRMRRLHRDLGVNLVGAAIIVDLVDRLDQLEADLARARRTQQVARGGSSMDPNRMTEKAQDAVRSTSPEASCRSGRSGRPGLPRPLPGPSRASHEALLAGASTMARGSRLVVSVERLLVV